MSFVARVKNAVRKRVTAVRHANIMLSDLVRIQREALRRDVLKDPRYEDPKHLARHAYKSFSQYGEDGMLAEIFNRIGEGDRVFCEIGIGDGTESNTTLLLLKGWSGTWIEGSAEDVARARVNAAAYPLQAVNAFVTRDNVNELVAAAVPDGKELALLSIDVDFNDYWLWDAIALKPRVLVIEYNATIPADVAATVAYRADAIWDGTTYFGTSLAALEALGREKGYCLVGCTLEGLNAFFVREDLAGDRFLAPFTAQQHYEPPRYWLGQPTGHRPGFGQWVSPRQDVGTFQHFGGMLERE